jgi:O-antigen/teichoic acid export membrane protein
MMLATGVMAVALGLLLAPILAHGNPDVTAGYRIAFAATLIALLAASYTVALQARDLRKWNLARLSQPVSGLVVTGILWRFHVLTLEIAMWILAGSMLLQLCWAYRCCHVSKLAPGRVQAKLIRPLATYGIAQIAAMTPAALNLQLDQLVLSQTVPAADLGRYAIAVSLTLVPIPLVSAIGNVAFPRLTAQRIVSDASQRLQRLAVLASAGLAAGMLTPLALLAPWLVPFVFGSEYRGAVPLLWILTPGAIFLACGQVVGDLLRGLNRPMVVAWAQGFAAVFTVVLLIVLVPEIGVAGAAIASTIAYGVALAVLLWTLWRVPNDQRGESRVAGTRNGV